MRVFKRLMFRRRPVDKWHAVQGYNELHRLLVNYGLPASSRDFTIGPLRRFFDLALEPDLSGGESCRIIEHARYWAQRARDSYLEPAAGDTLSKKIEAEVNRLAAMGARGRWVISVFDGDATHHAAPPFPSEK